MRQSEHTIGFRRTLVALAVLAACGYAYGQDATTAKPENSVSAGFAHVTGDPKDRSLFGQYNGLREDDNYLLLDFDYVNRNDATATWLKAYGRNLGLDTREAGVLYKQQGSWKLGADYSELVHYNIRTINTGASNLDSTSPVYSRLATPGTGSDVDLHQKRESGTINFDMWFGQNLLFESSFKDEKKTGARFWGRGYDCAAYVCGSSTSTAINQNNFVKNALLAMPEPLDATTKQLEAKLTWNYGPLNLTGGYYGSWYNNDFGSINPTVPNVFNNGLGQPFPGYPAVNGNIIPGGGMSLQQVLQSPVALPPDNDSQQVYLSGNYAFTPTTKLTFKAAYAKMTQDEDFASMGLTGAPAGVNNLGGKVENTQFQIGITSRPYKGLNLLANYRYEKNDDKTPNALYNVEGSATFPTVNPQTYINEFWFNNHTNYKKEFGKLEAGYLLPYATRVTFGIDYKKIEREVPTEATAEMDNVAGLSALRTDSHETGYRLEVRRSMSESLNGAVTVGHSNRNGSDWTTLSALDPNAPGTSAANLALINQYCNGRACYGQVIPGSAVIGLSATSPFPIEMVDTSKNYWKANADYTPIERLTLQVNVEQSQETNQGDISQAAGGKGWRETDNRFLGLDASFQLAADWAVTGYVSRGVNAQYINHSTGYLADISNSSDAFGVALKGRVSERIGVGFSATYLNDVTHYNLGASPSATGGPASATNVQQAALGLSDVNYRESVFNFYGTYALNPNSDLRFDLTHFVGHLYEWTWSNNGVPFTYADNTTVTLQPNQTVTYLGLRYAYHWK
jgi:MtrB/PioB family decaheme-associated outer membrane protein